MGDSFPYVNPEVNYWTLQLNQGGGISAFQVVGVNGSTQAVLVKANSSVDLPPVGISLSAVANNAFYPFVRLGPVTNGSWSFSPGLVYLDNSGNVTQTLAGLGSLIPVGFATSPTSIYFNPSMSLNSGGSGGTVSSVALTMPTEFSVSGSPITSSGTLAVSKSNETANKVWAGPTSGGAAQPTFRSLVNSDFPTSGVTAGSYTNTNLTVNAQGIITVASSGTSSAGGCVLSAFLLVGGASGANTYMGSMPMVNVNGPPFALYNDNTGSDEYFLTNPGPVETSYKYSFVCPYNGTAKNLYIVILNNFNATGTYTTLSDTSDTFSFSAGDTLYCGLNSSGPPIDSVFIYKNNTVTSLGISGIHATYNNAYVISASVELDHS